MTYQIAHKNNIEIIDATCPVVLRLQKRIKQEFRKEDFEEKQIVIYGKNGHAEVLGLVALEKKRKEKSDVENVLQMISSYFNGLHLKGEELLAKRQNHLFELNRTLLRKLSRK